MALSLAATWVGIILAYDTGWPVGFFIATLATAEYVAARLLAARRSHGRRHPAHGDNTAAGGTDEPAAGAVAAL